MKQILLFGAGKSATCLIDYLIDNATSEQWHITIADTNAGLITAKTNHAACTTAIELDIKDAAKRNDVIAAADIVISMMPPALHMLVAQDCLIAGKNLLTASYVDEQLKTLAPEIEKKGLLFLCEMGLDPGIDHMSAMQLIDQITANGGKITAFKSHCGGLVAPESDDNPWHYKISWNPRNVVLAGNAGAEYKVNDTVKHIPYQSVFSNCETIDISGLDSLAWYPNRDALSYIPIYKLEEAATFIRTTLRHPAFCQAWNLLVAAQCTATNDEDDLKKYENITSWFSNKINAAGNDVEGATEMFRFLGLYDDLLIPPHCKTSADILQYLLETRLVLHPNDKDMIVMKHEIDYVLDGKSKQIHSSLVVKGTDNVRTAMAKTVGLPLGIAAKLILNGTIQLTGLHIPITKEIYKPVLNELSTHGIQFYENVI